MAYAVTDRVVDLYVEVADAVEQDLDEVEENVFSTRQQDPTSIQRIYQLKRELVEFRRAVVPLQRPLTALTSDTTERDPGARSGATSATCRTT